jgi:hypothetical protein
MAWLVYDFTDENGASVIGEWIRQERLTTVQIAHFKQKVGLLKQYGSSVPDSLLAGPIYKNIYKLRINPPGKALRPMLCKGPIANDTEFTLLFGAIEENSQLYPEDSLQRADENRTILIANPDRRRLR